jgi:Barrel-sandwich domain of CusB or HlyD membrane-fusion
MKNVESTTNKMNADFVLKIQATFLASQHFDEATFALATDLAIQLGFERVSIGLEDNRHIKIAGISHTAKIDGKSDTTRLLIAAMEEAAEQTNIIQYPDTIDKIPRITLAHAALSKLTGNQVLSVPILQNGHVFGVITFERNSLNVIKHDEVLACEQIAYFIGPLIHLKQSANQSLMGKTKQIFTKNSHVQNNQFVKLGKWVAIVGTIGLFALLLIPIDHNVNAPARLEGLIQRALVASEDGFLQQTYVRPSDQVKANQVLAELADDDLKLEQQKWQSEVAQYESAYGAALAGSDRFQMVVNQSKRDEANSQLVLIEQKLKRTKITAPFDGVIISGDLKQSLGSPVQKGDVLMTISPIGQFRLIAEVDERDITYVKANQTGTLALVSLPDVKTNFTVKSITPVANTKDGRNFFEVEGSLDANANKANLERLSPGLEGVVKIKIGEKPAIWLLTHRIIDWLRITLWSWGLWHA